MSEQTWPTDEHDALVIHKPTGWIRWDAACPCGWQWCGMGGKEAATTAARVHNGEVIGCTCYDTESMEYDDIPCSCCKANGNTP
jgi:hypothetical protein